MNVPLEAIFFFNQGNGIQMERITKEYPDRKNERYSTESMNHIYICINVNLIASILVVESVLTVKMLDLRIIWINVSWMVKILGEVVF